MSYNADKESTAYFVANSSLQVWLIFSMPDLHFKHSTFLALTYSSAQHLAFFQANLTKYRVIFTSPSFWGTHTVLILVSFPSSSALSLGESYH